MQYMTWLWLGAIVVFGGVEAATAGLVSIWFVVGSAAALLAALLDASVTVQLALFVLGSAAALALTRPLVKKLSRKVVPTNADRVIGCIGKVTETIDNENASGAVYADGKVWSARSAAREVIPAGTMVKVLSIEGVKLFVELCEMKEGAIR